jgi:hypothetical protein
MSASELGPEDDLRQSRLSRFGRVLALVALGYVALVTSVSIWLGQVSYNKNSLPLLLGGAAFAALWLLLRGAPRSPRFVRAVELATLFVGTTAFASVALVASLTSSPDMIARTLLSTVLLAYAVYVPSSARHTLVVALLMTVPLATSVFLAFSAWDPALHDPPAAEWRKGNVGDMAYPATLVTLVLWGIIVAIAVAFSKALYGLRQAVRDIRRLGQYTLEQKLGEGGMGVVYRASHAMLRRPTAVKLLLPDRAGKDALARFEREVQRTAMLTHPNTVTVFDYGRSTDGVFYYAMELLDGISLEELVELAGPQPEERVVHLLEQIAASLAEAHDAGLIHRDIKPGNILLVDRGGIADLVKVVDFGLVKDIGAADATHANVITGTPLYIAPETMNAPESVDGRADLYALAAVGYWLLTGTHVFDGKSILEVCAHHLHSAPEPPSTRLGSAVSADLEALLLACLAKRPGDRPASAQALRARLRGCAAAGRWTNERAARWWTEHRPALQARRATDSTSSARLGSGALLTVTRMAE